MNVLVKVTLTAALVIGATYLIAIPIIGYAVTDHRPPTVIAESIAQERYGDVCPRNVPRSPDCRRLFGQVEREYLQQNGGYR